MTELTEPIKYKLKSANKSKVFNIETKYANDYLLVEKDSCLRVGKKVEGVKGIGEYVQIKPANTKLKFDFQTGNNLRDSRNGTKYIKLVDR